MDLVALGTIILLTNPKAVVLSVYIGVGGCLWPISSNNRLAGIACLEFKNRAAADVNTCFMILTMLRTAPLSLECMELLDM